MVITIDQIRTDINEIMSTIPEFEKSKRGKFLYSAKDDVGEKVKVQYKGHNFKIMVGKQDLIIKSIPLRLVRLNSIEKYLKQFLVRHTPKEV